MQRESRNLPAQKESPGRRAPDQGNVISTHNLTITHLANNASVFAEVVGVFASVARLFLFVQPAMPGLVAVMAGGAA